MHFRCRVLDLQGRKATILRHSSTQEALLLDLRRQGYTVLEVTGAAPAPGGARRKLSPSSLLEFTRSLHMLLSSGLGLKEALKVSGDIFEKEELKNFLEDLTSGVEKGNSLREALEPYAASLGTMYLSLIQIGEKTGSLTPIFGRLTEYLSTRKMLKDKLLNALTYPSLVLAVALGGLVFLVSFIFPALETLTASLRREGAQELQQNLAGFQDGLTAFAAAAALTVLAGFIFSLVARQKPQAGLAWSRLVWNLPLVGGGIKILEGLSLSFSMETLLEAGYSAEVSLGEAAGSLQNRFFRGAVERVRSRVLQGTHLSQAFRMEPGIPLRIVTWIQVGEQSGDLKAVFRQLRLYYQQDLDTGVSRLMSLMEPLLILGVGVMIIFLILNFVTPVFSMLGNLL